MVQTTEILAAEAPARDMIIDDPAGEPLATATPARDVIIDDPTADLAELIELLDLRELEQGVFLGRHPAKVLPRTFGGQLVAQSIIAAGRSIKYPVPLHVLNVHFIRGGDPTQSIEYRVRVLRETRSFANCMVTATQGDNELVVAMASFQATTPGLEHCDSPMPAVADPDELPAAQESLIGLEKELALFVEAPHPIDMRYANDPAWIMRGKGGSLDHNRVWMRAAGPIPDDPLVHTALLGYSSDTTVLDSIVTTHGLSWGLDRILAVTMNHSIWFHRPVQFDEWSLYSTRSPVAAASRGLGSGHFYNRAGEVLATVTQEGVIKHLPRP